MDLQKNKVGMDPSAYDHMSDEFTKIVSTFADWDARNQAGVKPLEKYSAIEAISSLDQMSEYLCNREWRTLSDGRGGIHSSFMQSLLWKRKRTDGHFDFSL